MKSCQYVPMIINYSSPWRTRWTILLLKNYVWQQDFKSFQVLQQKMLYNERLRNIMIFKNHSMKQWTTLYLRNLLKMQVLRMRTHLLYVSSIKLFPMQLPNERVIFTLIHMNLNYLFVIGLTGY